MFCNKNISLACCYVKNVSGHTAMSFLSETNIKKAFEWNLCCLRSNKVRDAVLRQCRKQLNEHSQRGERSGWPCEWWSLQYTVDEKFMKTNHLNSLTDKTSYILDGIQHWFCIHEQHWLSNEHYLTCIELFFTQNISRYTCLSKRDARIKLWMSRKGFTKVYLRVPAPWYHCGNARALQTTYQPQELTPPPPGETAPQPNSPEPGDFVCKLAAMYNVHATDLLCRTVARRIIQCLIKYKIYLAYFKERVYGVWR